MANTAAIEHMEHQVESGTQSKFKAVQKTANFLLDPKHNPGPDKRRTRAFLRTARYAAIFIFWRLVRYAKYAAVGALTAAVAGTAIGTFASGVGFILAPTGIVAGGGVGLLWGLGKFGWRTLGKRVWHGNVDGASARHDEQSEERGKRQEAVLPRTEPW